MLTAKFPQQSSRICNWSLNAIDYCAYKVRYESDVETALPGLRESSRIFPQKGEFTTAAVAPWGSHFVAMANTGWRLGLSHSTIQAKDASHK
eukprot:s2082_g2.t1